MTRGWAWARARRRRRGRKGPQRRTRMRRRTRSARAGLQRMAVRARRRRRQMTRSRRQVRQAVRRMAPMQTPTRTPTRMLMRMRTERKIQSTWRRWRRRRSCSKAEASLRRPTHSCTSRGSRNHNYRRNCNNTRRLGRRSHPPLLRRQPRRAKQLQAQRRTRPRGGVGAGAAARAQSVRSSRQGPQRTATRMLRCRLRALASLLPHPQPPLPHRPVRLRWSGR